MSRHLVRRTFGLSPAAALRVLLASILLAWHPSTARSAPESPQLFHLIEITQIMAGFNGDTNIQAVELRMISSPENQIVGSTIDIYDAAGNFVSTLGTFGSSVPNTPAYILCATSQFASLFGITPNLVITPGIPSPTGQVQYNNEPNLCPVNTIPYGAITALIGSASAAPPLPTGGATALVRIIDDTFPPSCPLAEDAGKRFELRSGSVGAQLVFHNNQGDTAHVYTDVSAVEAPPRAPSLRVSPNPFHATATIEAPNWAPLTIHDVEGRLIRVLTCAPGGACPQVAGAFRGTWDGTDSRGRLVPSGVYYLRYAGRRGAVSKRIVFLR